MFTVARRFFRAIGVFAVCLVAVARAENAWSAVVIRFVDGDVSGGSANGTTWGNAYKHLKPALADAASYLNNNPNDTIEMWVASTDGYGPYRPDRDATNPNGTTGSTDRALSFNLVNDLTILGGFTGFESAATQRDTIRHVTVLSGDRGTADDYSDNSYHVVTFSDDGAAIIDGFTVIKGNANGASSLSEGGGMNVSDGTPIILRCIFSENHGVDGGGVKLANGADTNLYNCQFLYNTTDLEGAGLSIKGGSTGTLVNCVFAHNIVDHDLYSGPSGGSGHGGGVYVSGGETIFMNCTLVDNSADTDVSGLGGGIYANGGASLIITNGILWDNVGGSGAGAQLTLSSASATRTYTDMEDGGTSNNNKDDPPDFVNQGHDDFRLDSSSPCIDYGSGDAVLFLAPDDFDLDIDANYSEATPDIDHNCRVTDIPNVGDAGGGLDYPYADMGAYEFQVDEADLCPADIVQNGVVDPADLAQLLAAWGQCAPPCPADIVPNGAVDAADLAQLLATWGPCPTIQCAELFGGSSMMEGGQEDDVEWPQVDMTEALHDWLLNSPLQAIWDWLTDLLQP